MQALSRKISIAPMMDYTDRHYRYMMRLMTRHTLLYTEMLHTNQILRGDSQRFLQFHPREQALALQLGGSDAHALAECARMAENYGYQEINLNVGCPSERVQAGSFGACLMREPELVADCVAAMRRRVSIPVTVKTRLGVDHCDSYEFLRAFIEKIHAAGCLTFIIHARKAWLRGLSPKQNRNVPPLDYARVYQLKKDYPHLEIIINGGVKTLEDIHLHLQCVDGVMIGREAYHNPYLFAEVDQLFFNVQGDKVSRLQILREYLSYAEAELKKGTRLSLLLKPVLGLFHGVPEGKSWRHWITLQAQTPHESGDVLRELLQRMA